MSFPTRSTCNLSAGFLLSIATMLPAQSSGWSAEDGGNLSAAASELDTPSLTALPSAPSRTLASMAGQLEPVVQTLTNVLNQYLKSGNRDGEANTLCALGNSYNSFGQQQKAIEHFQQALAIYRQTGDRKGEASALTRIGDVYHGWGFPDIALHFYLDALPIHSQTGDKLGKAVVLNNLGVIYLSQSNKKKSLDYLNQALSAYREAGDRHAAVLTLINIGAVESFLAHDPQRAISLFQQAISELESQDDRSNEADAYELLGAVWAGLHKKETAEMNYDRALALYREAQDSRGEGSVMKRLRMLHSTDLASAR
jgi:tetratricopeptide (TPR) repeat protein